MPKQEREIFYHHGGSFIDPGNVGSSVQWYVRAYTYEITHGKHKGKRTASMHGCLNLSDCDRRITWGVSDVDKIDNAIAELKRLRAAMVTAGKLYDKYKHDVENDDGEDL